jgi:hypothetical protein
MNNLPREILIEIIQKVNLNHQQEIEDLKDQLEKYQNLYGDLSCSVSYCQESYNNLYSCRICQRLTCLKHLKVEENDVIDHSYKEYTCHNHQDQEQLGDYDLEKYNNETSSEYFFY